MNSSLYLQVLLLFGIFILIAGSPVPTDDPTKNPTFVIGEKPDFPVADQIEEDKNIKTHVIGKMDDLEATTWVSSLSELNFTFPPDMAKTLELEEFVEPPQK